jgi:hypothetical protein
MRKYVHLHYTSFRSLPRLFSFFPFSSNTEIKSVSSNKMCVDFIDLSFRFFPQSHQAYSLIKNAVVCDMMPYNLVEIYQSIRDTCLNLQGKSLISLLPTRWKNLSELWDPYDSDDEEYCILRYDVVCCDINLRASSSGQKEWFALLPESGWRRFLQTASKFLPNSPVSHTKKNNILHGHCPKNLNLAHPFKAIW